MANLRASDGAWWAAAAAVFALLAVPFFLVDVPPVGDYPNHLARLFVLAFGAGDPVLSQMYQPHWAVLPNLGLDVIGPPLLRVLPVHVAGRILLAGAALLPVIGVVVYHRAVFGVRSWWPLASAIVAFNGIFLLGFMNFLYGLGLAFIAAAGWVRLQDRPAPGRVALAAVAGVVLFFCHLFAVLFFGLLIGANELARWWRAPTLGDGVRRAAQVLIVMVPAAILYAMSPLAGARGVLEWSTPMRKLIETLSPFLTYHQGFGAAVAAIVLAALILLWRRSEVQAAGAIALVVLAIAYLVSPRLMNSGAFIDTRVPVMMVLLAFACTRPRLSPAFARWLAVGAAALLVARVGEVAAVWYGHRADLAGFRDAIGPVEPGARVLLVTATAPAPPAYRAREPAGRVVPGLYRTDLHLAALLVIERRAFWPLLFADPRQQPLTVRPPYDVLARPLAEPPDYRRLAGDGKAAADAPYLAGWAGSFDYVLLANAGALADPAAVEPERLELLNAADVAALYRVRRPL